MLPQTLKNQITAELNTSVRTVSAVYGGDINRAAQLVFEDGSKAFVKWNESAPADMFEAEAKGLKLLAQAQTELLIPAPKAIHEQFLVLDWIEEGVESTPKNSREFGRELAKLHRKTANYFGLNFDNYIGRLPQSNNQHSNWPDFFAIERIEPQIKMGVESGKLNRELLIQAPRMYKKLGSIFPTEPPALLHGDLWSGNYLFTTTGQAAIYDPAVYFGHREMDMAMTRLFGGFSADFYSGYQDEYPLFENFEDRVSVYNLYPILVHANLFGGSYCRQAEQIIARYA